MAKKIRDATRTTCSGPYLFSACLTQNAAHALSGCTGLQIPAAPGFGPDEWRHTRGGPEWRAVNPASALLYGCVISGASHRMLRFAGGQRTARRSTCSRHVAHCSTLAASLRSSTLLEILFAGIALIEKHGEDFANDLFNIVEGFEDSAASSAAGMHQLV